MNTKNTKKMQEQFSEAVKNPQEFASNLNTKNQEFSQSLQSVLLSLPQDFIEQQKELQERISACAAKVQEITTKQPVDVVALQQTILQFHTENFAIQTRVAQENFKKAQNLFGIYSK